MNDHTEILKRRFWDSIKPQEQREEKRLSKCSIYFSSNNLNPSSYGNLNTWTLIGEADELTINSYKYSNYFEFSFEKSNDVLQELFIINHYAVLIVCKNVLSAKKLHLFNNNNEFYLFNDRFYFKGFPLKPYPDMNASLIPAISRTLFVMTYFF